MVETRLNPPVKPQHGYGVGFTGNRAQGGWSPMYMSRERSRDGPVSQTHRRLPRYVRLYFCVGEALVASRVVDITAVVDTSLHLLIYLKWPLSLRPALPTNQMQTNKLPNKSNNYKTPDLNCNLIYLIPVQRGGRAGKADACFPEPGIWFGYRLV